MQANHWTDVFISNRRWLSTAAIIALSVVVALGGGLFVALLGGPIALGAILGLIVLVLILRRIEVGYAALDRRHLPAAVCGAAAEFCV